MQKHTRQRETREPRRVRLGVEALEGRVVLSFAPAGPFPVGFQPFSVAVGDFNGDGKLDLAAASFGSNSVGIRLGDGQGGFTVKPDVAVGPRPATVVVADFNRDGLLDFAAASNSDTVSIRLGNGIGGFSNAPDVAIAFFGSPPAVAVGDFNGDGIPDFAAGPLENKGVNIRLGNGAGGFSAKPDVAFGDLAFNVAVGDFNGDGHADLAAVLPFGGTNTVGIRLGDGTGGFTGTLAVAVGNPPGSLALGDFNGDGRLDFAVAKDGNTVGIRLGNGAGSFTTKPDVAVGSGPLALGDFNGDGKLDFAVVNFGTNTLNIRLGDGAGGFSAEPSAAVGPGPHDVAAGDFNGDGKPDLVVVNFTDNSLTLLLNTFPAPPPPPPPPLPPALPPVRGLVASLVSVKARKKRLKVVVRYADTGAVKAEFNSPFQKGAYKQIAALALDTDGDGAPDAVQITAVKVGLRKKKVKTIIPV